MIYVAKNNFKFPFSKGILARSMRSSGLPVKKIYDIVFYINKKLDEKGISEISTTELKQIVRKELLKRGYKKEEKYYKISRRVAHLEKPIFLLIGGAAGVGKSTISAEVAHRLGIKYVVGTDSIREIMRFMIPKNLLPVLHTSSFKAGEEVRNPFVSNTRIHGFSEQTALVNKGVQAFLMRGMKEGINTVINGVHLVPGYIDIDYNSSFYYVFHFLLYLEDRKQHIEHFKLRAENSFRNANKYIKRLDEIREIQEFMREKAEQDENSIIIKNTGFYETVRNIIEYIFMSLEKELHDE